MTGIVQWRCDPNNGLRVAMRRLAVEAMEKGEYEEVEIL